MRREPGRGMTLHAAIRPLPGGFVHSTLSKVNALRNPANFGAALGHTISRAAVPTPQCTSLLAAGLLLLGCRHIGGGDGNLPFADDNKKEGFNIGVTRVSPETWEYDIEASPERPMTVANFALLHRQNCVYRASEAWSVQADEQDFVRFVNNEGSTRLLVRMVCNVLPESGRVVIEITDSHGQTVSPFHTLAGPAVVAR
jgi:hypothetical protein